MVANFILCVMLVSASCFAENVIDSLEDLEPDDVNRQSLEPHILQIPHKAGRSNARSKGGRNLQNTGFAAILQIKIGNKWFFRCGGSLVARDKVLTSVSCAQTKKPLRVLLGSNSISFKRRTRTQRIRVIEIFKHPRFERNQKARRGVNANNVAVLKLAKNAVLNRKVRVIPLARKHEDFTNTKCSIIGFGFEGKTITTNNMRNLTVSMIDRKWCQREIDQRFGKEKFLIRRFHACSASDAKKVPCLGDNGNGLVCDGRLYGVVSTVDIDCVFSGQRKIPATYMKVPSFRPYLDFLIHHL